MGGYTQLFNKELRIGIEDIILCFSFDLACIILPQRAQRNHCVLGVFLANFAVKSLKSYYTHRCVLPMCTCPEKRLLYFKGQSYFSLPLWHIKSSLQNAMTLLQTTTESLVFGVITSEKLWELGIGALVTIISILGSAYLAYRYALKKFKKETPLRLQRDLYNKKSRCYRIYGNFCNTPPKTKT